MTFRKGDRVRLTKAAMRRTGARPCCRRKLGDVVKASPFGVVVRLPAVGHRGCIDVRFSPNDLEKG